MVKDKEKKEIIPEQEVFTPEAMEEIAEELPEAVEEKETEE